MALIEVQTSEGPRNVRVCDYCLSACIPYPSRFCSGRCSRSYYERLALKSKPSTQPERTDE